MKKYLLIIILFSSQFLLAQSKNQFTLEPTTFEPEFAKFMKAKSSKGELLANEFILNYSLYSNEDKVLIIELLNSFRNSNVSGLDYYEQLLKSIILIDKFKKGNSQSTASWLISYKNYIANKKVSKGNKQKFVESNYNVITSSILSPKSKKIKWKSSGELIYDSSDIIKYSFTDSDLYCTSGTDSLRIYNVDASFNPSSQTLEVKSAKMFWNSKVFSSDSLYVTAKNFEINVNLNNYKVDSVELYSGYFIKKRILGKIEDRTESNNYKKEIYPVFKSYITNYYFKNITPGVDFSGGLTVRKNTFYGVGDKSHRASLYCKKYEKNAFTFRSKGFVFHKKSIHSVETSVSIRVKEDSIYHPQVAMKFDISIGKLEVNKNNSKLSQSAFSNSYSNLDMYLKTIIWKSGNNVIVFDSEAYIDVPYVSNKYYEREIFKQFQGTNSINPLIKLRDIYDYFDGMNYYSIELIANQMRMPKEYATHLLMELAAMGYVYIEVDLDRVTFSEKFLNLVDAHRRRIDYDIITFNTPEGKPTRGSINLETGEILLLGISRINLSAQKRVYVFPTDSVIIQNNLDFKSNGDINVGNYEFHGSDYYFNYDDFKIVMNGNQQMEYYVPSWRRNRQGKYYFVKVKNPIDSLKGELFIDEPTNKSGRLRFDQYPTFNNTRESYVFYDLPEIKDSIYKRNEVYVKLDPFELDSLNAVSSRNVKFEGTIFTRGIFPDFQYHVNVQPDYSLGFLYDTEIDGFDLYDKGNYKDEITLNMQGLNGRGRISYLSSEFESMNVEFYPDSLQSIASIFTVSDVKEEEINTPSTSVDSVSIFWKPKADSMTISLLHKPFLMYDSTLTLDGKLIFAEKKLTGNGYVSFETAEINSNQYNFYSDYFEGDSLDFDLRENIDSPFEFGIQNAYGKVDMVNRKGEFLLQGEDASVHFIANQYVAYINSIKWNMDDKTIDLKSTNEEQIPWFVSVDTLQDSLRFQAKAASYSLITNELDVSEILGIEVADAMIYPDSLKFAILDNGWMEGLENAEVRIGVDKNEHILEKANIEILSSNQFRGDAEYYYTDIDSIKHPIILNELFVDTLTNTSIARGDILPDDEFMLNPYFSFNGKVEVSGNSPYLRFKGYSGIQNYCDDIDAGEIPIENNVDPNNVMVEISNFDNLPQYSFVYNGIYSADSTYSAAFLSTDRSLIDYDFISAKGSITYDEPEACYVIGGDVIDGVTQDEVRFYNDECRLGAKGELKFYNPDKVIEIKAYGNIDYDMNAEIIQTQLVLGFNFEFNKLVMDEIRQDLEIAGSKDVFEKESKIQKMAFSRLLNKPYGETESASGFFGQELPKELQFNLLLSDMDFFWDADQNLFLSDENVRIHSFNGHLINKIFTGRVEIKKRKGGDEFTIYFVNQSGKYFYFRYRNNVMDFHTNQKQIMERFDAVEDEDRSAEVNGIKYRFKKASRLKVRSFQNKYD